MEQTIWNKDITHHIVGTLAVFGLVVSSLVATMGVAAVGVEAQLALAQQVSGGGSNAAAVTLSSTFSTASYCAQLSSTLERGSTDNSTSPRGQVTELQKFLSSYYSVAPTTIVIGTFGPITQSYVMRFQQEQGLPTTGVVATLTRAAIAKVCTHSTTAATQPTTTTSQPTTSTTQPTTSTTVPNTTSTAGVPTTQTTNTTAPSTATGVTLQANPSCPAGTAGIYPNCNSTTVCPSGYALQSNQCVKTTYVPQALTCTLASSASSVSLGSSFTISWKSTNAASAYLDDFTSAHGSVPTSGSKTISTASLSGAQTLQEFITVYDASGNKSGCTVTVSLVQGAVAVQTVVTIDAASLTTTSQTPTITGSASNISSNNSVLWVQGNTVSWMSGVVTPDTSGHWSVKVGTTLPNGLYTVQFLSGSQTITSGTLSVAAATLAPSALPVLVASPAVGLPPLQVQMTANNISLTGINDSYYIDWGDASVPTLISNFCRDVSSCTNITSNHAYVNPGTYTATLKYFTISPACAVSTTGACSLTGLLSTAVIAATSNSVTVGGSTVTTGSVCTVSVPSCPNFPTYAGTYTDPDATAQNNVARCSVRASEYYSWCGSTLPVTTTSTQGSTVLQSTIYPHN